MLLVDISYNRFDIMHCEIVTKQMVKQWAFRFDKRMIREKSEDEIDTLPYGVYLINDNYVYR